MNAAYKSNSNVMSSRADCDEFIHRCLDFTDSHFESEYVLSTNIPLQILPDVNQSTLAANRRSSSGQSAPKSVQSVPIFSSCPKEGIKRGHKTWQEISSEINQFAADNMKNAGWDDLWAKKKKSQEHQVDEAALAYLSSRSLQDVCKAETVFQDSLLSQQKLQAWDKMMGLKRSHSRTMTKSSVTRKKMIQVLKELKMMREREKERDDRK